MCGFAGFVLPGGHPLRDTAQVGSRMAGAIAHRGPDDSGVWSDDAAGVTLAHRRLSIIDVSAAGHQPMESPGGRFMIVFNGEIYNHLEIRASLEAAGKAPQWRGHSDTETLLAAIDAWGIATTMPQTVGMFALAVWDREQRTLHLVRDRFGEKPLYYGWVSGAFVFGSELKALRSFPGFTNQVSRQALTQYLRFLYVPAPRSIYEDIFKLEPGCALTLSGRPVGGPPPGPVRPPASHGNVRIDRWWSVGETVAKASSALFSSEAEALDGLEDCLKTAVKAQCLADVPLGAFLSGGVDSSTIVALMQQQASNSVKTFTIGFEDAEFDESPHARAVAQHLGTAHTKFLVTAKEAREVIRELPEMYDEPFADSSQIPTHLVCRAARQQVTVALSGDGGDELFGGYNRYFWAPSVWKRVAWMPYPVRRGLASAITAVSQDQWNAAGRMIAAGRGAGRGVHRLGDKAHKLAARLSGVRTMDQLYVSLISEWQTPLEVLKGGASGKTEPPDMLSDPLPADGLQDERLRMMYWDALTYLPDDILCKVDRASMATSLETRVPFLDHRVAEFAWRLPISMKIRNGQGKWALRQILYRHVPRELIERPKTGFGIPIGEWLRGSLRPWAEELLGEKRLEREGFFDPVPVRRAWQQHLSDQHDWTGKLWSVLMFQAWLEAQS